MKDDQASHTAEGAAAMRAAGNREALASLRNPDHLAQRLISPFYRLLIGNGLTRAVAKSFYNYKLPGMYEAHLARTHHFDAVVEQELAAGDTQLLVLGAGFDTRAYRFQDKLGSNRAYEVDHPATSALKRQRIREAGLPNDHVTYVEVDFEKHSIEERLEAEGFDRSRKTIVTWEGVVMYLNTESVRQVMRFVASLGAGSSIVFDYTYPEFVEDPGRYPDAQRHLDYVAAVGEPYIFGLRFDEVGAFLEPDGLQLASNIDAGEMTRRYLQGHPREVMSWYAIAHAVGARS